MYAKDVFFSWNSLDSRIRMLLLFYLSGWWMLIGDPLLLVRQKIPSWCSLQMAGAMLSGDPAIFPISCCWKKRVGTLPYGKQKSHVFVVPLFGKTHPRCWRIFFLHQQYMLYHCFFQWLGIKQSHCGQWICSIWLFLHVFKRCHLISIPFDAQLLQRTWQKSRILVVKSHDENPR